MAIEFPSSWPQVARTEASNEVKLAHLNFPGKDRLLQFTETPQAANKEILTNEEKAFFQREYTYTPASQIAEEIQEFRHRQNSLGLIN